MQAGELKNKIQIYENGSGFNEFGEDDDEPFVKYANVKAKIIPNNGTTQNIVKNTEMAKITHKIIIRSGPKITKDMYIMYEGQRYDIKYWQPIYKNERYMEILTVMEV